ncbi:hypothetical protein [Lewinella sp. IMCC34183]|uniref:hypothetical protein n=1 Tax=Lewinella sp. IMCC34183 TaxID=2248762 RepID=UPI000E243BF8|nr:hypothetical protein [Lewinella sp. IMCC34183]
MLRHHPTAGTPLLLLFLGVLYLAACHEEPVVIAEYGDVLTEITHTEDHRTWKEKYTYSEDGKLVRVDIFWTPGLGQRLSYLNDRVDEIRTYLLNGDILVIRDSFAYNNLGQLHLIYRYANNAQAELELNVIHTLHYDTTGKVREQVIVGAQSQRTLVRRNFFWNGNNIERMEYFGDDNDLRYEYFYTYDDKVNYKKGLGIYLNEPVTWTENNVREMDWTDHYGDLDMECKPCISTITSYNKSNLPTGITRGWESDLQLSYR